MYDCLFERDNRDLKLEGLSNTSLQKFDMVDSTAALNNHMEALISTIMDLHIAVIGMSDVSVSPTRQC